MKNDGCQGGHHMNIKKIYIIKMKGTATALNEFREHLKESKVQEKPKAYYNLTFKTSDPDRKIFTEMSLNEEYHCALLDYTDEKITCLYWAKCEKYNGRESIHCRLLFKTTNRSLIENFVYSLQLDLENDFPPNSYINYEVSSSLIEQMHKFEEIPFQQEPRLQEYSEFDDENSLSPLAQKNQYCRRRYNLQEVGKRREFQRDYDRIVYSKAYRRMVDKAQIFSSKKGDHYRTRMTHTLIVCQIARSISNVLKLNSSLAEAIAAGHDLGHTPFGHQGERTLNAILTGEPGYKVKNLATKGSGDKLTYPYGGFKHNYQSVRVATLIESQYLEIDGLDLSEQTLNGMWMHTHKKGEMSIKDFSDGYLSEGKEFAYTLEGQVVAIADEIAQRSHDIDDAFTSHLITFSEFIDYLELGKFADLKDQINHIIENLETLKDKNRLFTDASETVCAQISHIIVNYFISDVCHATSEKMNNYSVDKFNENDHKVDEKIVCFSEKGESLCKYLNNIITRKVINSHEVTLFDQNASDVVLTLFKAYYRNPMLLHDGTLERIWNEYRKQNLEVVDFKEGKPEIVKEEWKHITTDSISDDPSKNSSAQEAILEKRKILVRNICDFISGMTDNYALNEYHQILS
jgi:dGTPase